MLHHVQAMNMIFLKLFLIYTFKDPNLTENLINLAENLLKIELQGVHGVFFCKSDNPPLPKEGRVEPFQLIEL